MPRNKFPEETEKRIIEEALKLFVEKGYDNTSIQDIIDATKLSKGAIYHHFDSKESILICAYNQIAERTAKDIIRIVNDQNLSGFEKLRSMFFNSYEDEEHLQFMASIPNLIDNPRFLALQLKSTIFDIVPNYVYPVIKEGIADGSIHCDYPLETAHAILLLSNVWLNPLVYAGTGERGENKIAILVRILEVLGMKGIDEGFEAHIQDVETIRSRQ